MLLPEKIATHTAMLALNKVPHWCAAAIIWGRLGEAGAQHWAAFTSLPLNGALVEALTTDENLTVTQGIATHIDTSLLGVELPVTLMFA